MTRSPAGWASATLEDVAEWSSGGTPKAGTAAYYGEVVPWAVIGDLTDGLVIATAASITEAGLASSSAKVVPAGTVLVAMYGSIGKLGIAGVDMATNQAIACARPLEVVTRDWLFWWLRYQRNDLLSAGKGGTQANISQTVLKAWPIPVAPLFEQERIVAAIEEAFSLLDAGEAGLHATRTRLKRMRDSVLAAAITGQLVPQDSRDSAANTQRGVGGVLSFPTGWRTSRACDLVADDRKIAYGILQPGGDVPGGVPMVRVMDIVGGTIQTTNLKRVDPSIADKYPRTRLRGGEVLLSVVGTIGRAAVVPDALVGANVARAVAVLPFDKQEVLPAWASLVFRYEPNRRLLESRSHEVARKTLNLEDVRAFQVPLPPLEEQAQIVAEVERQLSFIESAERAVSAALVRSAGLRRSVLKAAFEGRLVPQDPSEEPASVLLERIAAERAAAPKVSRRGRAKVVEAS